MADPHQTDAHLRIAHSILEQIMCSEFSKRRLSILLFILRLSWGCGKKEALIPLQGDFKIVGIGKGHIKAELDWLIEARVIFRAGAIYSFNKDYDQWRVSRANGYRQAEVTKLVKLNIRRKLPKGELEVTETGTLGYQNGNSLTPKSASSKERLKKGIKKGSSIGSLTSDEIAEIATLYEGEIGRITQVVTEALNEAIQEYPIDWIKDAIREAVKNDVRKWRYIEAILERWKKEGRGDKNDPAAKYRGQKYGHMIGGLNRE